MKRANEIYTARMLIRPWAGSGQTMEYIATVEATTPEGARHAAIADAKGRGHDVAAVIFCIRGRMA